MNIIETQRLSIGRITIQDADNLSLILADPEVMQFSTVGVHSRQQIQAYIDNCQKQYDLTGYGHWAIYNRHQEFIGVCGLNRHSVDSKEIVHINYRLAAHQQGKGYASESIIGVLGFANNSLKLNRIFALIDAENLSSVKVAKGAGFRFRRSSVFRTYPVDIYQVDL